MKKLGVLFGVLFSGVVYGQTTAQWDLHPQAAELTAIELEFWTSANSTPIKKSEAGNAVSSTVTTSAKIGDTIFVKARACKAQNCSPWTANVSKVESPKVPQNLQFAIQATITGTLSFNFTE